MITRRTLVASAGAVLPLQACGPAAGPIAATTAPEIAATVSGVANIFYGLLIAGGLLARKSSRALLQTVDAARSMAEGADYMLRATSEPRRGDSLGPLAAANTQVTGVILFKSIPILPGSTAPPRYVNLMPIIWNEKEQFLGHRRQISAEELLIPNALYGPGLEMPFVPSSGVYRIGYHLSSDDEPGELYGGGPIMHVFDDDVWNYRAVIEEFDAIPHSKDLNYTTTNVVNPWADPDLALRLG